MTEAMAGEGIGILEALAADGEGKRHPLHKCVRDAIENYFEHLDGHPCRELHRLVIREIEAPLLEAVMRHTGSNQSKAAECLGISRGTLRKKLREYRLT